MRSGKNTGRRFTIQYCNAAICLIKIRWVNKIGFHRLDKKLRETQNALETQYGETVKLKRLMELQKNQQVQSLEILQASQSELRRDLKDLQDRMRARLAKGDAEAKSVPTKDNFVQAVATEDKSVVVATGDKSGGSGDQYSSLNKRVGRVASRRRMNTRLRRHWRQKAQQAARENGRRQTDCRESRGGMTEVNLRSLGMTEDNLRKNNVAASLDSWNVLSVAGESETATQSLTSEGTLPGGILLSQTLSELMADLEKGHERITETTCVSDWAGNREKTILE